MGTFLLCLFAYAMTAQMFIISAAISGVDMDLATALVWPRAAYLATKKAVRA